VHEAVEHGVSDCGIDDHLGRAIDREFGDDARDAREAAVGLPIPEEAIRFLER
jgi:hypothetical protein